MLSTARQSEKDPYAQETLERKALSSSWKGRAWKDFNDKPAAGRTTELSIYDNKSKIQIYYNGVKTLKRKFIFFLIYTKRGPAKSN